MTSLYKQSIPIFTKYLNNLSGLVQKGAEYADEKAIKHDDILNYRLISDMRGLTSQVQFCCNTVVFFVDRVAGLEHVTVEDNEETFDQLYQRIEKTIAYLNKVEPKKLDDKVDSPVLMETKMGAFEFASGQSYFSEYAMANFHFHLTSAYCILRTQGVPVGALDYMKDVFHKKEAA
ncbi:hypothetical protein AB5N19_02203 [Seiridium cardinale]|uniref:DUF1993 domain-containing protein n=1 Tax=Seiridium cardinale TaxID=138064 RepID=A0ABR2X9K0_9PEZI